MSPEERILGRRDDGSDRWRVPDDEVVARLQAAANPIAVVGPDVVLDGAIPGLHALAAAADLGVLNTWGAKGVFDWRSRHHLATIGLQSRDAELGGIDDADVVVTSGLDPHELLLLTDRTVDVHPWSLAPLAELWSRPRRGITVPPVRERLAAATQAGWAATGSPLWPSQATRNYGEVFVGGGGIVAADAGLAGYWVARTLGTTRPMAVHVPPVVTAGFALTCCILARRARPWAPALAVVEEVDEDLADEALSLGACVEVWCYDGEALDADDHRHRLRTLGRASLRVSAEQLPLMIEAAGDITAWA